MNVLGVKVTGAGRSVSSKATWTRRAVAVAAVTATALGGGIAYAYWTTTATGSGTSKADTLNATIETAPTYSAALTGAVLLHPGLQADNSSAGGDLQVSVTNHNSYTLYVDSVAQSGLITSISGASGTCSADTGTFPGTVTSPSQVYVGTGASYPTTTVGFTVTLPAQSVSLPANATTTVVLPHVVSMGSGSVTGCQGASFTVPVQLSIGTS